MFCRNSFKKNIWTKKFCFLSIVWTITGKCFFSPAKFIGFFFFAKLQYRGINVKNCSLIIIQIHVHKYSILQNSMQTREAISTLSYLPNRRFFFVLATFELIQNTHLYQIRQAIKTKGHCHTCNKTSIAHQSTGRSKSINQLNQSLTPRNSTLG